MKKVLVALALSAVAFGASAAQLITKEEASHFKLTHVGSISVGPSGGQFSSPSDLHDQLSKLADERAVNIILLPRRVNMGRTLKQRRKCINN